MIRAALEREMAALGVSSKQTGRARQAFMRSARQAGFFAHGEDRLVRPSVSPTPTTKPIEIPLCGPETPRGSGGGGNGSGGSETELHLDPLLMALLRRVPSPEEGWPIDKRLRWLRTFVMNISQVYDEEGAPQAEIAIGVEERKNRV